MDICKHQLSSCDDSAEGRGSNAFREIEVRSMLEAARLLEAGNLHRAVAAHNLNEHSSRSHAICTLQVKSSDAHSSSSPGQA